MKYFLYLLAALLFVTAACKKDKREVEIPLTIRQFLPNSGNAGTVVTIHGTGFSRDLENNAVSFNGTAAKVVSSNDTTLVVISPEGGSTGPLEVTVGERSATNGAYTYQSLSVHGISPANGPAGTNVAIHGTGFTGANNPAAVTINGKEAIVVSVNDTLLVAAVPEAVGSGPIKVSRDDMEADGPSFIFQAISKVKPLTGSAGTHVTITGEGFETTVANNIVAFNGKTGTVISATATSLVVEAPAAAATGPLTVTINGQKTTGPVFTVVPPPVITAVAPLSGPAGIDVTISGRNFSVENDENIVRFNGKQALIKSVTDGELVVTLPAGAGKGPVTVTVNDQPVTGPEFTEQNLGVSRLVPDNSFNPGKDITLYGTGFSTTLSDNNVTFNGISAQVKEATDTTLVVALPAGFSTGTVDITVKGLQAKGPVFRRAGVITLAGGPGTGFASYYTGGIAVDSKGYVYLADQNRINKISPNGDITVFAGSVDGSIGSEDGNGTDARFGAPKGLAFDANDNLYVADGNSLIRKITPAGTVSTISGFLPGSPSGLTVDAAGNVFVLLQYPGLYRLGTNGHLTRVSPDFYPEGITQSMYADAQENIYTGWAAQLRKYAKNGSSTVLAGSYNQGFQDGKGDQAMFFQVSNVAGDNLTGNLYVTDEFNSAIRMVGLDGKVTTITGAAGTFNSFVSGYQDGDLNEALFSGFRGIAVDKKGDIYVVDWQNEAIRKIIMR